MSAYVGRADLARPSRRTMAMKRGLDIGVSMLGLGLLLPLFLIIAVIIKLDSPGPVFFRQERVGLGGRRFRIVKFRSMYVDAAQTGPALTLNADQRISRAGMFLRKTKLDELPQLVNVFRGSMSLVGPRPEVPEFIRWYAPEQIAVILSMRPGMTDYAAIAFCSESSLLDQASDPLELYRREIMPVKFVQYQRYRQDIGILNDLRIILATISLLVINRVPHWLGIEGTS